MKHRLAAWKGAHTREGILNVYFLLAPTHLTDSDQVVEILDAIQALPSPPVLVVVDTLNRNMQGSENEPGDMSRFIAGCDDISLHTGACVLVTHHTGHEATH